MNQPPSGAAGDRPARLTVGVVGAGRVGPALAAAVGAVTGADGLHAVTPVVTASYSGLFTSFFDVVDTTALHGKPVLMAAPRGT
ncbi:NAD(P)H-dependent oxidoreductase, partial [Streptomyces nanhaiensis]|uniref:NAD(P)H-dependent oxidoreductase n=1 Tax=Streptomyces nanhaiensis TaxID=679319 RepID=UPI00399CC938